MRKNILFLINNDELFTFPIVLFLIKKLEKKFNIYLKLENTSLKKKIKIILILFLDGSLKKINKFYKNKISLKKLLEIKNVNLFDNNVNKNFEFGISINYPKKIKIIKFPIYNFHSGNFQYQRGTFIFFYKYIYNWLNYDITFHLINKNFDAGRIVNYKTFRIKNMRSMDIISLPLSNKLFYYTSINKIINNKNIYIKLNKKVNLRFINKEPSFSKIFFTKYS